MVAPSGPSKARKRRKEIIQSQRSQVDEVGVGRGEATGEGCKAPTEAAMNVIAEFGESSAPDTMYLRPPEAVPSSSSSASIEDLTSAAAAAAAAAATAAETIDSLGYMTGSLPPQPESPAVPRSTLAISCQQQRVNGSLHASLNRQTRQAPPAKAPFPLVNQVAKAVVTAETSSPTVQTHSEPIKRTAEGMNAAAASAASVAKKPKQASAVTQCAVAEAEAEAAATEDKASASGKKPQIRYDPDVPMSKEQLAAWRREARRVRNRESAAASRQRIRNRISELEDEVGEWKSKYTEAMERLQRLEHFVFSDTGGASLSEAFATQGTAAIAAGALSTARTGTVGISAEIGKGGIPEGESTTGGITVGAAALGTEGVVREAASASAATGTVGNVTTVTAATPTGAAAPSATAHPGH